MLDPNLGDELLQSQGDIAESLAMARYFLLAIGIGLISLTAPARSAHVARDFEWSIYDEDPDHLWNRIHRSIFSRELNGREIGANELDPLIWPRSRFLLQNPRLTQFLDVLREFVDDNGEQLTRNPLKRAVFQHDLWGVYDWLGNHLQDEAEDLAELEEVLVRVMQRVSLQRSEIDGLKSNYQAAIQSGGFPRQPDPDGTAMYYLPQELFSPESDWICMGEKVLLATDHVHHLDGRSVFTVHLNLPGGRQFGLRYLAKLRDFPNPVSVHVDEETSTRRFKLNPRLPQFPVGTQLALVRRMLHVTADGKLAATPLVESIQLRLHRKIPEPELPHRRVVTMEQTEQQFFEFIMDRQLLFGGKAGGLRPKAKDSRFTLFHSHGFDPIEKGHIDLSSSEGASEPSPDVSQLNGCFACHGATGIFAMNSYLGTMASVGTIFSMELRQSPRELEEIELADEDQRTIQWKESRESWLRLQRHWR